MLFDNLLLCLMTKRTTECNDSIAFVILELIFSAREIYDRFCHKLFLSLFKYSIVFDRSSTLLQ